jgi:hypothetical protein
MRNKISLYSIMKFYCLKSKSFVDVPESKVKYEMKNGRRMAVAECPKDKIKLVKFVKKD